MNQAESNDWPFAATGLTQLNHGSFGACPRPVLEAQNRWRARFQANPTGFVYEGLDEGWAKARARLCALVHADESGLVFVRNATEGVNAVLASYPFAEGDEILVTSHGYNACTNAAHKWGGGRGAVVKVADIPFPLEHEDVVVDCVLDAVTPRTKLVLIDHITSPTALVFPLQKIIPLLKQRGIDVLVDGAHAPGQIALDIGALGADFYTGNCHKWLCAPPGTAFLWVSEKWRERIDPLVVSHGWNSPEMSENRLHRLFDYTGTGDWSGVLCLPELFDFLGTLHPQGHAGLMARNHALALEARDILGWHHAPANMIGAMVSTLWQKGSGADLRVRLLKEHNIMLWSGNWPPPDGWVMRLSAFAYNRRADYERLLSAL